MRHISILALIVLLAIEVSGCARSAKPPQSPDSNPDAEVLSKAMKMHGDLFDDLNDMSVQEQEEFLHVRINELLLIHPKDPNWGWPSLIMEGLVETERLELLDRLESRSDSKSRRWFWYVVGRQALTEAWAQTRLRAWIKRHPETPSLDEWLACYALPEVRAEYVRWAFDDTAGAGSRWWGAKSVIIYGSEAEVESLYGIGTQHASVFYSSMKHDFCLGTYVVELAMEQRGVDLGESTPHVGCSFDPESEEPVFIKNPD